MTQLINRQYYTELITPFINMNIIKVLTGQRRVGKSCILQQLRQQILESAPNANIIFINKEYEEFSAIRTSEDLSAYIIPRLHPDVTNYLFIDDMWSVSMSGPVAASQMAYSISILQRSCRWNFDSP